MGELDLVFAGFLRLYLQVVTRGKIELQARRLRQLQVERALMRLQLRLFQLVLQLGKGACRRTLERRIVDLLLDGQNLGLVDLELDRLLVRLDQRDAGALAEDDRLFVEVVRINLLHRSDRVEERQKRHPVRDPDECEDRHHDGEEALSVLLARRADADVVQRLHHGFDDVLHAATGSG